MTETQVKLAFLGDVTCDRPMLKAAKSNGRFSFIHCFEGIMPVVSDCDEVVANLETVFAGTAKGYNPAPISYNSPDELCEGIKAAGITLLTTANNHCLDMGGAGIDRTLETLDRYGLKHTGTLKRGEDGQRYIIETIHGIKIAFVSMTDRLNNRADGTYHALSEWKQVNNLRALDIGAGKSQMKRALEKMLPMEQIKQCKAHIKRILRIPLVKPYIDNQSISEQDRGQIEWGIGLLHEAKSRADFVVACIHSGGQFNNEPGQYSVQLYDALEPYCDVIIGNHPHVVQRMERHESKVRAYSLGGVNMSSSADYISRQTDFAYSAVIKIGLSRIGEKVKITNIETELLHAEETDNCYVIVRRAEKSAAAAMVARRLSNVQAE